MKKIIEKIEVHYQGKMLAQCHVTVYLSWYLYPIILVTDERYLSIPGALANQGHAQIALPHEQQLNWWKCLLSWKRYKKKYVIPYVANLEHLKQTGKFAAGTVSYT